MLNKKPTHNRSHWKFGSIVPLLLLFMFSFNVKTEAQISSKVSSLSAVITKESKEENLEKLVSFFNNNEIELKFENVQRNSEGDITNIEVFAQNQNIPEEKGWFKLNDIKGISTFQVTVNDGKIAFSENIKGHFDIVPDAKDINASQSTVVTTSSDQEDPIIYVDGKKMTGTFDSNSIDTDRIATINVQKTSQAGERSKVVIVTKEFAKNSDQEGETTATNASQSTSRVTTSSRQEDPVVYVDGKKMEEKFDSNSIDPDKIATINVEKASESVERSKVLIVTKDFAKKSNQKTETKTRRIIIKKSGDEGSTVEIRWVSGQETPKLDALYVVDGKVMGKDFDLDSIDPEDIESVNVLKGDVATDKYGKKGRKGVIEINLMD